MTMEVNLFLGKLGKCCIVSLAAVLPQLAVADDRATASSTIDLLLKSTFKNILNNNISPNMPPVYRGAVDDLISSTVAVIGTNSNFGSGVLLTQADASRMGLINRFGKGFYVATVDHVVSEKQDYAVVFYKSDGSSLDEEAIERATIVGTKPSKDLAILKISNNPTNSKGSRLVIDVGNSSIGDDVQAIGHPNSMWWTYTRGYISQFRRDYEWYYDDETLSMKANVIQTQTPITTGNSGGPLFTKDGAVLGLNAFGDPEFQSINFAVSSDELVDFAVDLSAQSNTENTLTTASLLLPPNESWQMVNEFDQNEDGRVDVVVYDTNADGRIDLGEFDTNFDGLVDHYEFDIFSDEQFSMIYFPSTEEYFAEWRIDSDGDGNYDLEAVDRNEDGIPDNIAKMES